MLVRGVRGAITVDENSAEAILSATEEMLVWLIDANGIKEEDVASALFTSTPDINAAFPAKAARNMGWRHVALMGFQEIDVPEGLKMCVRVLIHWNTDKSNHEIKHAFLRGATALRPDLVKKSKITAHTKDLK
ncbi:MAG: chorismate mutase [Phototrophicaceae bacterium]